MAARPKTEPDLNEAAERAGLLIRGLQSRLRPKVDSATGSDNESPEELERQLQNYFASSAEKTAEKTPQLPLLNQMRNRVIEGAVDRILGQLEQGWPASLENEVVDRLIQRVLQRLEVEK
jgi:hypothetical protein